MKKLTLFTFAFVLFCSMKIDVQADTCTYWDGWGWSIDSSNTYTSNPIEISYEVTYDYEEAYKMLEYVNEIRREAGVQELILKDDLMDLAMQRAAECNIYFSHIRPDGSSGQQLSYLIYSENICSGGNGAENVTNSFKDSPGHYETMIDPILKYVGFGRANGTWCQVFCVEDIYYEDGFDYKNPKNNKPVLWDEMTSGQRKNYTDIFTAKVNPTFYEIDFFLGNYEVTSVETAYIGEILKPRVELNYQSRIYKFYTPLNSNEYDISFDNHFTMTDRGLKCIDVGKTTVTVSLKDYPQLKISKDFTVTVRKNSVITKDGHQYKVTSASKKSRTVTFWKAANVTSVTIPKSIKIGDDTYKVTKIADKAFKDNKTVKKVQVGSNITTIGKEAFRNCSNLKNITVKSTKIKSVGKNALKGINKKAVVKVPRSKLSKYKKLFKNKGQKSTVKIKK